MMLRLLWIASLFSLLLGCVPVASGACRVKPEMFCKPFEKWERRLSAKGRAELMQLNPDLSNLSWKYEAGIRAEFGLWKDNEFTRFFRSHGLEHAEMMSRPVLTGFLQYLAGEPVDMAEVARRAVPPPMPPPPPENERQQPADVEAQPNNSSKPTPLRGAA